MSNDKQTEELAIATAVWSILREVEDECDKEVEDLHFRHHVWDIANAVRAALSSRPVPLMANGLTEEETDATASVVGLSSAPAQGGEPVAWIRYEWNKSGSKSLVFEKPAEPSLADEARGVVYEPLYASLSSAPAREQWQPIETAPKDGSMFLGWVAAERWSSADGEGSGRTHDVSQIDFCWWRDNDGNGYFDPACGQIGDAQDVTHWMPLPAAPGATAEPAPAREPMTDEQVEPMFRARKAAPAEGIKDEWYWYAWGVEDAERHHGITKE